MLGPEDIVIVSLMLLLGWILTRLGSCEPHFVPKYVREYYMWTFTLNLAILYVISGINVISMNGSGSLPLRAPSPIWGNSETRTFLLLGFRFSHSDGIIPEHSELAGTRLSTEKEDLVCSHGTTGKL